MQQIQLDNVGYGTSRNSSPPIQMVELSDRSSGKVAANEYTPLTSQVTDRISETLLPVTSSLLGGGEVVGGPDYNDDSLDFFKVICEEMNKINNFFIGKLAELRILLEEITRLACCTTTSTCNIALQLIISAGNIMIKDFCSGFVSWIVNLVLRNFV